MFKTYKELIEFTKNRHLSEEMYKERHHIVPKYKGGSNSLDNLVDLTLVEHVEAHYLLALEADNNRDKWINLNSALFIINSKKYTSFEDKIKAVNTFLKDKEAQFLLENCKKLRQNLRKNSVFVHKENVISLVLKKDLQKYLEDGWVPGLQEKRWYQYKNQKPTLFNEKSWEFCEEKNFKFLDKCPICQKENTYENYCCCEEHKKEYDAQRKVLSYQDVAANTSKSWTENDYTERKAKIGAANKKYKNTRMWMHKNEVNKVVQLTNVQQHLQDGWTEGRFLTEEEKKEVGQKISKKVKGQKRDDEFKQKVSESSRGRKWWNNGVEEHFCKEQPEGFVPGYLFPRSTKENRKESTRLKQNSPETYFTDDTLDLKNMKCGIKYYVKCPICEKVFLKLLKVKYNYNCKCQVCQIKKNNARKRLEKLKNKSVF